MKQWMPIIAVFLMGITASAADIPIHSYIPNAGFVPDSATAISIAKAVLIPIYGKEAIEREQPFTAKLNNGTWTVTGSLTQGMDGGTALVELAKSDGRIERVSHGR
jgi:NTF2 fold immunity protein